MSKAYDLPLTTGAGVVVAGSATARNASRPAWSARTPGRTSTTWSSAALDVRKASFLSMDRAVEESAMEYGGITPIGLPDGWRLLMDTRVLEMDVAIIGSGVRRSKLLVPGRLLADLPGAEVIEGLAGPLAN